MSQLQKAKIGCLMIEVGEMVRKAKKQGFPFGVSADEIAEAIGLMVSEQDWPVVFRTDSAGIYISTPAMADAGWEIPVLFAQEGDEQDENSELSRMRRLD